ncbi:MAG: hypothetical protein K6A43_02015 [Treponema sp.]|nr:hypothetical protein [Treponema sp.]
MKKFLSKYFITAVFSLFISIPLFAEVKTSFTLETRPEGILPGGLVDNESTGKKNLIDVKMPAKTRGIERYQKKNVFDQNIPDSFLFYRSLLNDRQKIAYDIVYKTLMNTQHETELTVKTSIKEFSQVMEAVRYDNPEAFWWSGDYLYWNNSDDVVTKCQLNYWIDDSKLEQAYEEFWGMTVPIIFYASKLPDEMSKIKYIHDYICLSTEYDYQSFESGNYGGKLQTAYSCAVEYKTVCAGYSSCFQYYMQQLGIPCASVWGSGHEWNFIKVNGQYYQMDVTWDDTQIVPCYFNLKHVDMQKFDMHGLDPLANEVIKKYPSTSNAMSYLAYFGPLIVGSPYTYQELGNFEREVNNPESAKVYQTEPQSLYTISNSDEFRELITLAFNSTGGNETSFSCLIPDKNDFDSLKTLVEDGSIGDWIYSLRGSGAYSYNYTYYTIEDSILLDLKLTVNY